ncbi:MAG: tetratricopeptide repeat protein [Acidobacteriota bacterium]
MKKESLLMLVAGVLLGAVWGFIGTREYYERKQERPPAATAPPAAPPAGEAPGPESFDPEQHKAMLEKIQAEIAADPKNVEKRVLLGNIYFDAGKFQQAIPLYEEALGLEPGNTDVLVDLGICQRNLGRFDAALAAFDRALALDPKKKQALYNRVVVYYFDLKDRAKAEKALQELESAYPGDEMAARLAREVRGKG